MRKFVVLFAPKFSDIKERLYNNHVITTFLWRNPNLLLLTFRFEQIHYNFEQELLKDL